VRPSARQVRTEAYRFYIEVALVAVLFYVGFTDFQTFKIQNNVVLLFAILYALFAIVARTPSEILSNLVLAAIMFAILLWLYSSGVIGGGDVKFMTVACLWVGLHCALLFSIILFLLIGLHVLAAWTGWATTKPMAGAPRNTLCTLDCRRVDCVSFVGLSISRNSLTSMSNE